MTVGQLSQLRATGMSWISIADILCISLSTLSRRRDLFGLVENYDAIPNSQLDEIIRDITAHTANAGERLVQGKLHTVLLHMLNKWLHDSIQIDAKNLHQSERYHNLKRIRVHFSFQSFS